MKKIIFTGPESSGKTTMSLWLKEELGGLYVPEFARLYLEEKGPEYDFEDLKKIADGQIELIDKAAASDKIVICDTGMIVLKVWAKIKFGQDLESVEKVLRADGSALYILCSPDIPWEADPLRESEHQREALFKEYLSVLESYCLDYVVLSGRLDERKNKLLLLNLHEKDTF